MSVFKVIPCFLVFFVGLITTVQASVPEYVLRARRYGADTKVTFRVVDDENRPVSHANVGVGFYLNKEPGKNPSCRGLTATNGMYAASHVSVGEVGYSIRKEGYYTTRGRIDFRDWKREKELIQDGKWQPYGKTYEVVLKPIKNPIQLKNPEARPTFLIPEVGKPLGFDLEKQDLIAPYGQGRITDFNVTLTRTNDYLYLEVLFIRPDDGAYTLEKTMWSEFKGCYQADTNKLFQKRIVYKWNQKSGEMTAILDSRHFLVLRTRSRRDETGRFEGAHYSKINGEFLFWISDNQPRMYFFPFFNPTFNDTNLESIWEYKTTEEGLRKRREAFQKANK